MTKKKSSEIFGVKMEIFSGKNVIQKSWSAKIFSVPPNSAPGLRHWCGRLPPSTGVHLNLAPSALRVDVINGWSHMYLRRCVVKQISSCRMTSKFISYARTPLKPNSYYRLPIATQENHKPILTLTLYLLTHSLQTLLSAT